MELRKDETPLITINTIKRLLMQAGIYTQISFQANPIPSMYSCRVEIQGLPGIGTNGKGTSETAALASAYSELMERLQNGILLESLYTAFPREKDREETISFVNILTGEKIYRNGRILNHYLGSNGMCAGNTYEEALSQGFCEIMERHVLRSLYSGSIVDKEICVIPRRYYCQYKIYDLIRELEERGFTCRVLNCSLGGKYPVAGFLIVNPDSLRGKFALGCDYDLEIALQRCVTELFQGKDSLTALRYDMRSIFDGTLQGGSDSSTAQIEYFAALRDWQGAIPQVLFTDREDRSLSPFTRVHTSKEAYELCISCLGGQYDLLVHDASFMEFPAYRILVPGLSMVKTDVKEYRQYCDSLVAVRNIAEQLQSGGEFRMQDLTDLAVLEKIPRYKYSTLYDLMGIIFHRDCLETSFSEHLAQLYYMKGQYVLAEQYMQNSRKKIDMFRERVIHAKACGWDDTQIDRLFCGVASDYSVETLIDAWIAEGRARFPHCPDCAVCGLRSDCAYETFRRISHRLDSAYLKWREEGGNV